MADIYVIQVMAHHGYGLAGWRTVRNTAGEPYSFATPEAAQAAMQKHFANLRDGVNVRVQRLDHANLQRLKPVAPQEPTSSSAPKSPYPPVDQCS
jgi:hypothetical protein